MAESVRNGTAARGRRNQTRREEMYTDEETDRRIAELAARVGIGGQMVVKYIEPTGTPSEQASAKTTVLEALAPGRPAAVSYLAQATGLTRPRVSNALRALADDGLVAEAGTKRQAKGPRQRLWKRAAT